MSRCTTLRECTKGVKYKNDATINLKKKRTIFESQYKIDEIATSFVLSVSILDWDLIHDRSVNKYGTVMKSFCKKFGIMFPCSKEIYNWYLPFRDVLKD